MYFLPFLLPSSPLCLRGRAFPVTGRAPSAAINNAEVGSACFIHHWARAVFVDQEGVRGPDSSVFPAAIPLWELHTAIKHLMAARLLSGQLNRREKLTVPQAFLPSLRSRQRLFLFKLFSAHLGHISLLMLEEWRHRQARFHTGVNVSM